MEFAVQVRPEVAINAWFATKVTGLILGKWVHY
jgi:hypothetical protein